MPKNLNAKNIVDPYRGRMNLRVNIRDAAENIMCGGGWGWIGLGGGGAEWEVKGRLLLTHAFADTRGYKGFVSHAPMRHIVHT